MQWVVAFLVAMFLLATCHNEEYSARAASAAREAKRAEEARIEARIEQEVTRRVEVARKEMTERDALLHTVSLIGLIVLTGGTVVRLVLWVRRPRFTAPVIPVEPVIPVIPVIPPYRAIQTSQASGITLQPRPQRVNYHPPRFGRVIDLRPVAPSPPVQPPGQQRRVIQQQGRRRTSVDPSDGWVRRLRRRCWKGDPDRQPNPPRRHHESTHRS